MPRYIVKRTFPGGLALAPDSAGARICAGVVRENAGLGVTWVQSFVTDDGGTTFCVYDAPDPDAIRRAATRNGLPVDEISQVSVLDPYFYLGVAAAEAATAGAPKGAS